MRSDRIRFVVGLAGLIILRSISQPIVELLSRVFPLIPNVTILLLSSGGNNWLTGGLLIKNIITAFFYLLIFYSLINLVQTEKMREHLKDNKLDLLFKILITTHTFVIYIFIQKYSYYTFNDSLTLLEEALFGFNLLLWLNLLFSVYCSIVIPVSIGYLLSMSESGPWQTVDPESPVLALIGRSDRKDIANKELEKKRSFWVLV